MQSLQHAAMRTFIVCTVIFFYCGVTLFAQAGDPEISYQPPKQKELTIGDKATDYIKFSNLTNYKKKVATLDDFKGKLVILDFWATWCSPCVAGLAKMQVLQEKFKDQIQIITITDENSKKIMSFFANNKIGKQVVSLATEMNDTTLSRLLPHRYISHEVWIDGNGIIRAITSDQYVNEDNISAFLANKPIDLPLKDDFGVFDIKKPLFNKNDGYKNVVTANYYSGFSGLVKGVSPGLYMVRDSLNNTFRYNQFNCSILTLYCIAYKKFPTFQNPKRCDFEVKDINKLYYWNKETYKDQWNNENLYSYEAVMPISYSELEARKRLKADLDLFFQFDSKIERRRVKCLILKKVGDYPWKPSNQLERSNLIYDEVKNNYLYSHNNASIFSLVHTMNYDPALTKLPLVVDETKFSGKIDLNLNLGTSVNDIDAWRKALNVYGLDLIEETRDVDILILKDKQLTSDIRLKGF